MGPGSENYLTTAQAADLLNITPAAVRRLVREGLLEVKYTRRYKFGEDQSFDRSAVESLLPRLPEYKRRWHAEEDLRLGAKKAAFKRAEDQKKTRAYQSFKERFLLSLEDYPEKVALLLRASFFLYHLNTTHVEHPREKVEKLYPGSSAVSRGWRDPNQTANPCLQLGEVDRFRNVVVSPGIKSADHSLS
jgi:hypothetical protein